jgi:hypothetical protein
VRSRDLPSDISVRGILATFSRPVIRSRAFSAAKASRGDFQREALDFYRHHYWSMQ